jgi:hypothetical protein
VGRDRPWKESHRHYSHLLALHPLGLITPDKADARALFEAERAGEFAIHLGTGASVVLAPDVAAPLPDLTPVPPSMPGRHSWPAMPSQSRDNP